VAAAPIGRAGPTNSPRSVDVESISHLNSSKLGIHIECFPNLHAGAPISDQVLPTLDLDGYLLATGPFANLENFDITQVLMSNEMTNGMRDWYLDTRMVSNDFIAERTVLTTIHSARAVSPGRILVRS
jgi:hypothetical protein